jgi:hypothetical protein
LPLLPVPVSAHSLPSWLVRAIGGEWLPPLPSTSMLDWLIAAPEPSGPVRQVLQALVVGDSEVQQASQVDAPTANITDAAAPLAMRMPQRPKAPDPT